MFVVVGAKKRSTGSDGRGLRDSPCGCRCEIGGNKYWYTKVRTPGTPIKLPTLLLPILGRVLEDLEGGQTDKSHIFVMLDN